MTPATHHTTRIPRRAHPAVTRAALCYHDRNDTESGRVAAQQRGTHRPTPCGYNRLIEVHDASNAIIATYRYDPFGRRLSKTLSNTTGQGSSTYYFYSAEGLIAEADANGQITQSYGYAPNTTFSTNPLWTKLSTAGTATYYTYQNDHLGTPQKLLNQSGITVWSATYDAFGRATVDPSSTITNNLRFPGQYADQETGLHYNWMRFYDPNTGRYVTSDPIGLDGGINAYAYAYANPMMNVDSLGLAGVVPKNFGKGVKPDNLPNPIEKTNNKNSKNENLPDWVNYMLCATGLKSCIPEEAFVCRKAECTRRCGGGKYVIDYEQNGPTITDRDKLNPPTPGGVPDECVCVKTGIRKNGPKMHPPGL